MIQQKFQFMFENEKYSSLCQLLEREMDGSRLLIFCETKRGCDDVTRRLRQDGWPALSIHGDKSQQERDWVLAVSMDWEIVLANDMGVPTCDIKLRVMPQEFRMGKNPIMLATDVAARGLGG